MANNKTTMQKAQTTFLEKINEGLVGLQNIKTKDKVIFYRLLSVMINS
jgi:hypothetical protein